MAGVRYRPLPQFDPGDMQGGDLIRKLRVLVRDLEIRENEDAEALAALLPGGLWYAGKGPPPAGLGAQDDYYLDLGAGRTVYQKQDGAWTLVGKLAAAAGLDAAKAVGDGVSLIDGISNNTLQLKTLVAGPNTEIAESGETVVISAQSKVDGGFFVGGGDATTIQIERGMLSDLPGVAKLGEPLFIRDTNELYFGTGIGVAPLAVRPANVIGLLDDAGRIAGEYLPSPTGTSVYEFNGVVGLSTAEADEGDIAIVTSSIDGRRTAYLYDGSKWLVMASQVLYVADVDSESASAGYALTADGAGGASWEPGAGNLLYTTDGLLVLGSSGELVTAGN